MKKTLLYIMLTAFVSFAFTSDKPAYKLYNQKGKEVKYSKMLKDLQTADIVFFGEHHTDPISHWMQFEITTDLFDAKKENLVIGAEMFEADNQLLMDEYLAGIYSDKKFEAEAKLWGNYKTDYKPVVEFAKENGLRYIATNIPRRYANLIYKQGFEGLDKLSDEAKQYIGPDLVKLYDPEVSCYKDIMKMVGPALHSNKKLVKADNTNDSLSSAHTMADTSAVHKMPKKDEADMHSSGSKPNTFGNIAKSQASKDATMAYFILKNWEKGKLFIHFDGAYHSDNFEGIVWWVKKLKPGLNIKTISIVYQEDVQKLDTENIDRANYIIAVPETMTQTNR